MISAEEAKELYDQSGIEVQNYLDYKIEPEIIKASKLGRRNLDFLVGAKESWITVLPTPFELNIMNRLIELGYRCRIDRFGDSYVPRGLSDDEGYGPNHTNYGFIISW